MHFAIYYYRGGMPIASSLPMQILMAGIRSSGTSRTNLLIVDSKFARTIRAGFISDGSI